MKVVWHVTRRVYVRNVGAASLVDDNPVVDTDTTLTGELHGRLDTDSRHCEIARYRRATTRHDVFHVPVSCERDDTIIGDQFNAFLTVDSGHQRTNFVP